MYILKKEISSSWETEAGRSQLRGQLGLHSKTLSKGREKEGEGRSEGGKERIRRDRFPMAEKKRHPIFSPC
jgi:hypothetical protein